MESLPSLIAQTDGPTALRILSTIASHRLRSAPPPPDWTPDLAQALQQSTALSPLPTTDADLARQTLLLLATDPEMHAPLHALLTTPPPKSFSLVGAIALTTFVLLVLQSHIKFARTPDGKWSVAYEKKPTTNAILKPLIQKLLSHIPPGPFGKS